MKLSKEFKDKIEESGVDPLQFILNIMEGKEFSIPHPFLNTLYTFVECIRELNLDNLSLKNILSNFENDALESLAIGYVPIELRARAGLELMQYCYPKRRSVEITATIKERKEVEDKQMAIYNKLFEDDPGVTNETRYSDKNLN